MTDLEDVMVDRNLEGRDLEKAGNIARAIELYEANVTDGFDGSHPYHRLALIYRSAKRHADVIRVCGIYIAMKGGDPILKERFAKWVEAAKGELSP